MEALQRHDMQVKARTVIPFRSSNKSFTSDTSVEESLNNVLTDPAAGGVLEKIVEAAAMNALIKAELADLNVSDNPFDAIYISELRADEINIHDVTKIIRYSRIRDLSDSISFDDEWED